MAGRMRICALGRGETGIGRAVPTITQSPIVLRTPPTASAEDGANAPHNHLPATFLSAYFLYKAISWLR